MTLACRRVFYFHGFDPASTGRYRRIFAAASARLDVALSDLDHGDGWRADRGGVTTVFRYLRYEDLVRAYQHGGLAARIGRGIRTVIAMTLAGAWGRLGPRTLALGLGPSLAVFAPIAIAALLSGRSMPIALGALALFGILSLVLLLRFKVILAADLFAYLLEVADGAGAAAALYEARIDALAAELLDAPSADETLIVGHSLGGMTSIRAVALALDTLPADRQLSLLTLGSVHGLVLAQRGAGRDRLAAAIARVASDPRVTWVDVTNPRDAFCVPLTDPLLLIGDRAQAGMRAPLVISAQLARAPRIPGDRRAVFAAMRRHMGYLLPPPEGAGFDYADWTTGPLTLAERTAGRRPSPRARMWRP